MPNFCRILKLIDMDVTFTLCIPIKPRKVWCAFVLNALKPLFQRSRTSSKQTGNVIASALNNSSNKPNWAGNVCKEQVFFLLFFFYLKNVSCPSVWHSELLSQCQDESQQTYFHNWSSMVFTPLGRYMRNIVRNCIGFISNVKAIQMEMKGDKSLQKKKEIRLEERRLEYQHYSIQNVQW